MSQTAEEFREEQKRTAQAQNQKADNAVPEQRPQAFVQDGGDEHPVTAKLRESGKLNDEPMPKSAYDKADKKPSGKGEQVETLREGAHVRVSGGEFEGAYGAVTAVQYKNDAERAKAVSGDPSAARFAKVDKYQVRTRGGHHALLFLSPKDVDVVTVSEYERGIA